VAISSWYFIYPQIQLTIDLLIICIMFCFDLAGAPRLSRLPPPVPPLLSHHHLPSSKGIWSHPLYLGHRMGVSIFQHSHGSYSLPWPPCLIHLCAASMARRYVPRTSMSLPQGQRMMGFVKNAAVRSGADAGHFITGYAEKNRLLPDNEVLWRKISIVLNFTMWVVVLSARNQQTRLSVDRRRSLRSDGCGNAN